MDDIMNVFVDIKGRQVVQRKDRRWKLMTADGLNIEAVYKDLRELLSFQYNQVDEDIGRYVVMMIYPEDSACILYDTHNDWWWKIEEKALAIKARTALVAEQHLNGGVSKTASDVIIKSFIDNQVEVAVRQNPAWGAW